MRRSQALPGRLEGGMAKAKRRGTRAGGLRRSISHPARAPGESGAESGGFSPGPGLPPLRGRGRGRRARAGPARPGGHTVRSAPSPGNGLTFGPAAKRRQAPSGGCPGLQRRPSPRRPRPHLVFSAAGKVESDPRGPRATGGQCAPCFIAFIHRRRKAPFLRGLFCEMFH